MTTCGCEGEGWAGVLLKSCDYLRILWIEVQLFKSSPLLFFFLNETVKNGACVRVHAQLCPNHGVGSSVMKLSRQEYWSGLPFPTPGDLPDPGIKPASSVSPALADGFSTTAPPGNCHRKKNLQSANLVLNYF